MGRKPKTSRRRPSFSKVLIQDYTTRLRLPHAFVQKHREFLPESAKLRTSSGKTWEVELEKTDDDDEKYYCCFVRGWSKFVEDLELKMFEFLVFSFNIGESTFDVSVYAINGCEKEISDMVVDSAADEDFDLGVGCHNVPDLNKKRRRSCLPENEGAGTDSKTPPRFETVLTKSRSSRVWLPKQFARAAGLIGKRAVMLEYPPKQRHWPVILDQRPPPCSSLDMAAGWHDFRKENRLVWGRNYSFEFDPTRNVIQVKEQNQRRTT